MLMVTRNTTIDSGEKITITETNINGVILITVNPGLDRGIGSSNPPILNYDLTVEKLQNNSWTEIIGSPIHVSDITEKKWSTADIGDGGIRVTIDNTGSSSGSVLIILSEELKEDASKSLHKHPTIGNISTIDRLQIVSSDTTLSKRSVLLPIDTSEENVTITLSTILLIEGVEVWIKDETGDASQNNIIVETQDSATIDGQTSERLSQNFASRHYYTDGTNWFTL